MIVGPSEYIIVGFPGNKFNGKIAPELAKLIDSGLIRILDLVVITKDDAGEVAWFEFDQLDELAPFARSRWRRGWRAQPRRHRLRGGVTGARVDGGIARLGRHLGGRFCRGRT